MQWPITVRQLHRDDITVINELMRDNPSWGRSALSVQLCHQWNWCREDGQLKDIACRELLRKLHRRNLIVLPPAKTVGATGKSHHVTEVQFDETNVSCPLQELEPVSLIDARVSGAENTFHAMLKQYHYLGFNRPVGQNMKYLIYGGGQELLGCLLFGAPAWKTKSRDDFIGWDSLVRQNHLNRITNNTRFLILPWVDVKNLASHVLAKAMRRLRKDWKIKYGSNLAMVETFVDTEKFEGTCYRAANWQWLGQTQGRSRQDRHHKLKVPVKDVWVYPLMKNFRKVLMQER